jgi:hypothetical protein
VRDHTYGENDQICFHFNQLTQEGVFCFNDEIVTLLVNL